jgi:uncharacterized membrane protein
MKLVLIMALLSFNVFADSEKQTDTQEYQIPSANRADTVSGNLDGSQTYDRVFGDGSNGGTCDYVGTDSGNDGSSYQTFEFHSPSGEMVDMEVVLGSLSDSLLFIYCGGFDPANPNANLVAIDDDGGAGFGSAITPADAVQLQANVSYTAVVAGFTSANLGTYDLNLGGDLVLGGPIPVVPQSVPTLSFYAMMLLALALIGFVFIRRSNKI